MFTGIVDHCAVIKTITRTDDAMTGWIETQFDQLVPGESIAVNGICLTVTEPTNHAFRCDLSPETLALTTANTLKEGSKVNVERALRFADRIGGHFVTGHVDKTLTISNIKQQEDYFAIQFTGLSSEEKSFIVKKGSVAVNGVSLTVNNVSKDGFDVMLIPHTLERTNLHELNVGDSVNIEFDMLTRVVINHLESKQ